MNVLVANSYMWITRVVASMCLFSYVTCKLDGIQTIIKV